MLYVEPYRAVHYTDGMTCKLYRANVLCPSQVIIMGFTLHYTLLMVAFTVMCWAQAPEDAEKRCTDTSYPDNEVNLMDSYNYEVLLPRNGTGNDPAAVWNDYSFDKNDVNKTDDLTYVSLLAKVSLISFTLSAFSGSIKVEDCADLGYMFVGGKEMELLKTIGFSLNT